MSVSDTAAELRRRRIKWESGENPGQSRCCDVRLRRVRIRFRQHTPLPPCAVGKASEPERVRRPADDGRLRPAKDRINLTLPRPPYRDEPVPRRVIPNPFRIVIPSRSRSRSPAECENTLKHKTIYCNENDNHGCCISCTGNQRTSRLSGTRIRHVGILRLDGQRELRLRKRKLGLNYGRA